MGALLQSRRDGSRVGRVACMLLSALAVPILLAHANAGESDPASPDPVTFVSYNLKNYLRMDRQVGGEILENAPKPELEIAKIVEFLVAIRPDILGVCEIGAEAELVDLQARLRKAGLDLPHRQWVDAADAARHVAALSRFPFVSSNHQTRLRYRMDAREFDFNRGIFDARIAVGPGYELRLLGVHLKSKREVREGDQALMRRNEAHLLRAHVDAILRENPRANILLHGDFNDTRNEMPIKTIQGRFGTDYHLRDIQVADKDGFRWTYYWGHADTYSRFDFAFASKGLYPEILQDKSFLFMHPEWFTASDHRPLVITINPVDADEASPRE